MPIPYDPNKKNIFSQPDLTSDDAIWDLLSSYADGESPPQEAARVEALLQEQPSLAGDLAFLRRTTLAVRNLAEVEPPQSLRSAIFAATTQRPSLARRVGIALARLQTAFTPPTARLTLAGGACVAAGLATLLLLPHRQGAVPGFKAQPEPATNVAAYKSKRVAPSPSIATPAETPRIASSDVTSKTAESPRDLTPKGLPHSFSHTDKMLTTLALGQERISVKYASMPIPTHSESRIKVPSTLKQPLVARNDTVQKPRTPESGSDDTQSSSFSPVPMMDRSNQRALTTAAFVKNSDDTLGTNIDANQDTTSTHPDVGTSNAPASMAKHIIVVTPAQLPPDARRYLTAADIKRQLDARRQGYSQTTLDGINRGQVTATLISGHF